jgi:trk system potassium uptake protein
MNLIVVGCGRVGVQLALSLARGHRVSVIDTRAEAFDRLGPAFTGRTVEGEGTDEEVLMRAGIGEADGLAAVTTSDNANAIIAKIARDRFHVARVVARLYETHRRTLYERLGLPTVASSTWGALQMEHVLLHPWANIIASLGDGEVRLIELEVPDAWEGKTLPEAIGEEALAAALIRGGQASLPLPTTRLARDDRLVISATVEMMAVIESRLAELEVKEEASVRADRRGR